MTQLFLSHTSADKPMVRKLAFEMRSWGLDIWLDEWRIKAGESITQAVQSGVAESDYLAIWITKKALASPWVEREWRTKLFQEINEQRVLVVPLLAEHANLPAFLAEKKYADFRRSYVDGLVDLAKAIDRSVEFEESLTSQIHGDWVGDSPGVGRVYLIVQGLDVSGTYQWRPLGTTGTLIGKLVNGRLVCRWFNGGDGCAIFEVSRDRLVGSWWGHGVGPSYFALLNGAVPEAEFRVNQWSMRKVPNATT